MLRGCFLFPLFFRTAKRAGWRVLPKWVALCLAGTGSLQTRLTGLLTRGFASVAVLGNGTGQRTSVLENESLLRYASPESEC